MKSDPTLSQLKGGAREFCLSADMISLPFYWQTHFGRAIRETNIPSAAIDALENGTIETSLSSMRLINSFFCAPKFPTDLCADMYPEFTSPGPFLTDSERSDINKHFSHLTLERAEHFPKSWLLYDMIVRANNAVLHFLRFLVSDGGRQFYPDELEIESRMTVAIGLEERIRSFAQ